ncbi:hypothetical protein HQ487_03675 [Candidatus Uhrbacteria bacterium]|nr:hypothetical protein [Candidatus Uhrbacteria bacterium]
MNRAFLVIFVLSWILVLRLVSYSHPVLVELISLGSLILFFIVFGGYAYKRACSNLSDRILAMSDPDGPDQGWDPQSVESARRRADGIE